MDATPADSNEAKPQAEGGETSARAKRVAAKAAKKTDAAVRAVQGELDAATDRLLRLQADFDNFRKRTLREKGELYTRANEDIVLELLPVLDHLDLAIKAAAEHGADPAFLEGFTLVSEQLLSSLKKFGVSPIDGEGEGFDPDLHEAISHLPSPDVAENVVMMQTRRGYNLGGKVLRAAQVVVSSGAPAAAEAEE